MTKNLCIVDLETSGFDDKQHQIIEIAGIAVNEKLEELDRFERKVHLSGIITESAQKITGYTREKWAGAVTLSEAMQRFNALAEGCYLMAHNIPFDLRFVLAANKRCGLQNTFNDLFNIDTLRLFSILKKQKMLESVSLDSLRTYYSLPPAITHSALNDCEVVLELYKKWVSGRI